MPDATTLDGKAINQAWRAELNDRLAALAADEVKPGVAVVRVGDDEGAISYGKSLARLFDQAELPFRLEALPAETPEADVIALLKQLRDDPAVHGIMLQEPVPDHLDADALALHIDPRKDIDGVHPLNAGMLFQGRDSGFVPATARGGMEILDRAGIELKGARAVVIGRSNIVGRPMALLLMHRHATVTVCHSRTRDLAAVCREADVLVAAVGRAGFVTPEMVKPGATVIDFGINFVDGRLCGDVAPEVAAVAGAMTPTPGGTGAVTTAALLANLVYAASQIGKP